MPDIPTLNHDDDSESGGLRSRVTDMARSILALPSDEVECPECGGLLQETRVRDPSQQVRWQGVPGFECEECGFKRAKATTPEEEQADTESSMW